MGARAPTVAFRTLGCRLNQAETDLMAEDLLALGFQVVAEGEDPDVVVVNTCTVTHEATRGSRHEARAAAQRSPGALVVVAGCYAVAEPEEAAAVEGVGMVAGNDEKDRIAGLIAARLGLDRPATVPSPVRGLMQIGSRPAWAPAEAAPDGPSLPGFPGAAPAPHGPPLPGFRDVRGAVPAPHGPPLRGFPGADRTRVNLKVQTGCDEHCTFCIIPATRGPLRSLPMGDLLERARRKAGEGTRELVLTGVHLGKYGWDVGRPDEALVRLLEGLLEIDGLARIRLSSILCRHLTPAVVGLFASEPRLCRFFHVPLQAGADRVLERMHRPYRVAEYLDAVERVKQDVPGAGIATDVIVGFPGETPEEFEQTLEVVERVGFLKVHAFRYSPRAGTPSASWPEQVSEQEKKRRSRELIAAANRTREAYHRRQVGLLREVLVESRSDRGLLNGTTDDFVRVSFEAPPVAEALIGNLALVRVEEATPSGVRGRFETAVGWEEANPRQ
jgi:threonylcarbamoyladenosine tRNA methylthiotransferase MtaB